MKLKVRGASETEVKSVLRNEFKESIDYRNCSKNPESSILKVDVRGTVDVGKLYERLKKMSSSVKIESVIPL
uniref:HMA domain-containing protein n=1 Tax=Leersia perrieri TaxID=77586 RepID=A0A0D9W238_9ORYZ